MVELVELKAMYYIVAAAGILVASLNYLRVSIEDSKKKRIEITNNMMRARDFEIATKRFHLWITYDILGHQLMKGLVDAETRARWGKYGLIIRELRTRFNGSDWMEGFEYLAGEMMKIKQQRSPGYVVPSVFYRVGQVHE
jgi:hypothetical protein